MQLLCSGRQLPAALGPEGGALGRWPTRHQVY